jgi:menaquinone-dependent protoporphyrinogen IX oxidase
MGQKEEVVMKVLVAVAGRQNATRDIAELIADELQASGLEVELRAADAVLDMSDYEAPSWSGYVQ